MNLPKMLRVRQRFDAAAIDDLSQETSQRIAGLNLQARVQAGQSVAVGCSSRGIHRYDEIVAATVTSLKALGLRPFLFPAMGSHGAATAQGQLQVLADAGVTEQRMGVPVRSSLAVIPVGATASGLQVLVDATAWQADHMVLINRIKSHTEFEDEFESGLQKMLAIGIGKQAGATLYHKAFLVDGYASVIRAVAQTVLASGKFLCGIGVVENAFGRTAHLQAFEACALFDGERALLERAKQLTPRLPFDEIDVLVIEEMGKEISGTGIDTKVVGRILMPLISAEPTRPRVKRIVVLGLTERTRGNADGVGLADFVTQRLVDAIDREALYANALAGAEPEHARIPMAMPCDLDAIRAAVDCVGLIATDRLKLMWVKNTAALEEVEVSVAYERSIHAHPGLDLVRSRALPMRFDEHGRLLPR